MATKSFTRCSRWGTKSTAVIHQHINHESTQCMNCLCQSHMQTLNNLCSENWLRKCMSFFMDQFPSNQHFSLIYVVDYASRIHLWHDRVGFNQNQNTSELVNHFLLCAISWRLVQIFISTLSVDERIAFICVRHHGALTLYLPTARHLSHVFAFNVMVI